MSNVETLCSEVARVIAEKKAQAESMQLRLVMGICYSADDRERVYRQELDLTLRRSMMDPVALVQIEIRRRDLTFDKVHEAQYRWMSISGKRSGVPVVVERTWDTRTETVRGMTMLMNRVAQLMDDEGFINESISPYNDGFGCWDLRGSLAKPGNPPPGPDDYDVWFDMDDVYDGDTEDEFLEKVTHGTVNAVNAISIDRARRMFMRDACKLGWLLHTLAFNGAHTLEDELLSEHAAKTLRAGGF